jgi:fluoride exporter
VTRPPTADAPPAHHHPGLVALVFVGGAAGTLARAALGLLLLPVAGVPFATIAINVVGAFLLGVLLAALARRGPDVGLRRGLRVTLGTGLLGGFTTYSALATDTAGLSVGGHGLEAVCYGIGTVLAGLAASWAGIVLGDRLAR